MVTPALSKPVLTPSVFENFFRPLNEWLDEGKLMGRIMAMPAVNVTENGNHYTVSLAAPGLKKDDFKIDLEGNILSISSEQEERKEEKEEKFTRKEYSYSSFSRSFTLPDDVKQEAINARYEDGVLKITLPRKEEAKKAALSKIISVK